MCPSMLCTISTLIMQGEFFTFSVLYQYTKELRSMCSVHFRVCIQVCVKFVGANESIFACIYVIKCVVHLFGFFIHAEEPLEANLLAHQISVDEISGNTHLISDCVNIKNISFASILMKYLSG